jgi:hypothetical protein
MSRYRVHESDPWRRFEDPSRTSSFYAHWDLTANPPILEFRTDAVRIPFLLRSIGDLYRWLEWRGMWVVLGMADERCEPEEGSVEAWARSADNPVGGWYGLRPGFRGRFAMYVPPVLEALGLIELEHNLADNRCRSLPVDAAHYADLRHFGFDGPGRADTASRRGAGNASGFTRNEPGAEGLGTT